MPVNSLRAGSNGAAIASPEPGVTPQHLPNFNSELTEEHHGKCSAWWWWLLLYFSLSLLTATHSSGILGPGMSAWQSPGSVGASPGRSFFLHSLQGHNCLLTFWTFIWGKSTEAELNVILINVGFSGAFCFSFYDCPTTDYLLVLKHSLFFHWCLKSRSQSNILQILYGGESVFFKMIGRTFLACVFAYRKPLMCSSKYD